MAKKKQEPQPPRFVLNLSEKQAQVLVKALDFFGRIGIGDIDEVQTMLSCESHCLVQPDGSYQAVKNALDFVKREIYGLEANAGFGIHSDKVPNKFKIAWDLQQVVRHKLAWTANPAGGFGVSYHEPMKSCSEPLATIDEAGYLDKLLHALRASTSGEVDGGKADVP